jgi:hypothetical protein
VGLIVAVFQSGTFKLPADDIVCLLLGFVIRGNFPAWEDLIRDTARLEGLVHSLPVRWKGIVQPFAFTQFPFDFDESVGMGHDGLIEVFLHVLRLTEELNNTLGVPGGFELVAELDDSRLPEQIVSGVGGITLGCGSKYPLRPAYELESLVASAWGNSQRACYSSSSFTNLLSACPIRINKYHALLFSIKDVSVEGRPCSSFLHLHGIAVNR